MRKENFQIEIIKRTIGFECLILMPTTITTVQESYRVPQDGATCFVIPDSGRKINVWSINKFSNELHIKVSVAFSVPSLMLSKNGERLLLLIVLQRIQRKGEEIIDKPIEN